MNVADFKNAMAEFASGVTVVTTAHEGRPVGMTVSAFVSVSLDPPLVLVCVSDDASPKPHLEAAGLFGVNVLGDHQVELGERFAGAVPADERFDGVATTVGSTGVPLIEGCLAQVECKVVEAHRMGDHTVFVGAVVNVSVLGAGSPLLHHRRTWATLGARKAESV